MSSKLDIDILLKTVLKTLLNMLKNFFRLKVLNQKKLLPEHNRLTKKEWSMIT